MAPTGLALLTRVARVCLALCCIGASAIAVAPSAGAAARDQLAQAIAATRGSYLVYNFGSGFPAPMLNAAGNWYDNEGGSVSCSYDLNPELGRIRLIDADYSPGEEYGDEEEEDWEPELAEPDEEDDDVEP